METVNQHVDNATFDYWHSCGRKRPYPSLDRAAVATFEMERKHLMPFVPYKCRYENHYHIGRDREQMAVVDILNTQIQKLKNVIKSQEEGLAGQKVTINLWKKRTHQWRCSGDGFRWLNKLILGRLGLRLVRVPKEVERSDLGTEIAGENAETMV